MRQTVLSAQRHGRHWELDLECGHSAGRTVSPCDPGEEPRPPMRVKCEVCQ